MPVAHPQGDDVARGWLYVALGAVGVAYLGSMASITADLEAVAIPIWVVSIAGLVLLANSAIGKAIGRQIAGAPLEEPRTLDAPEEVYLELDELRARMLEMEDRQQFAERLLADRGEPADPARRDERGGA
jgi:PAS domain-containing protein